MAHKLRFWFVLVLAIPLIAACSQKRVQVEVPPVAPVEGIERILVLPFENFTSDPGLAWEFETRVIERLRASGWYASVESARTSQVLADLGIMPDDFSTPLGRRRIIEELRADAVIFGEATFYFEDVYLDGVVCSGCNNPNVRNTWFTNQYSAVDIHITARMVNLHTGEEVHMHRAAIHEWDVITRYLNWYEDEAPPASLIPSVNRQQIPALRERAISRAVHEFTKDILPTYEWRIVEEDM